MRDSGPTRERASAPARPTSWWLGALERRIARQKEPALDASARVSFASAEERRAAIKFFNAAYRAEESGLRQAHELADVVGDWDADLAKVLRLYGDEEGWHRELLTDFLRSIGGDVQPMGTVTRTFYSLYGRARRMDSIVLTNLMFETIGSTTYRLTLSRVQDPLVRQMLIVLTRDEAFHVPLNVHFLKCVLAREPDPNRIGLRALYHLLFIALVLLPLASRPKAKAFDHIGTLELSRAYAEQLALVFAGEPDLPFAPPTLLLKLLGVKLPERRDGAEPAVTSALSAELAEDRDAVRIREL